MSTDVERLRSQFLVEATELLNEIETLALNLETGIESEEAVRQLFRNVHTLKGAAGMFGFPKPEAFLHQFEFLLDSYRSKRIAYRTEHSSLLLESADLVRKMLFENYDQPEEEANLKNRLMAISNAGQAVGNPDQVSAVEQKPSAAGSLHNFTITAYFDEAIAASTLRPFVDGFATLGTVVLYHNGIREEGPAAMQAGDRLTLVIKTGLNGDELQGILDFAEIPATFTLEEGEHTPELVAQPSFASADHAQMEPTGETRDGDRSKTIDDKPHAEAQVETTMRIQIEILEKLMNLVSELVLNRNQLLQLVQKDENSQISLPIQQLNRLISGLQEAVMQTRMQPVGNAWTKLPRMVRDLSMELGKKIELLQTGAKTELDRHIIQVIQEPLLHLVRNAVDHGIELPEVRRSSGKSETGTLKLNAFHEAGQIVIEISDDGAGIDPNVIRKKVIEKGWMKSDEASKLSRIQLFEYLFEAGFSTKETVTRISGRGVGLDAVKKSLEKVGGNIEIQSIPGKGTSFKIKIPLTLAIISALIVRSADTVFAIPQISIQELVLINGGNLEHIDQVQDAAVFHLRTELLPLISLSELLGNERRSAVLGSYIVVLQQGDLRFGLLVDEVMNIQEIVVKPISRFAKSLNLYSGATIIGGSDIILILDTNGIAQKARLISDAMQINHKESQTKDDSDRERSALLLVSMQGVMRAVPLDLVDRLEEFDSRKLEIVDGKPVIQYRGRVLALHHVPDPLPDGGEAILRTVVFKNGSRMAGMVVDYFDDVVDVALDMDAVNNRPGILGLSVVAGRSMEIIDVGYYMDLKSESNAEIQRVGKSVFIIEETAFVRNQLKFLLKSNKYKVYTAADVQEAMKMLREGNISFDAMLVGTDIKGMHVRSLVALLRGSGMLNGKPLVAVSPSSRLPEQVASLFDLAVEGLGKREVLETLDMAMHLIIEQK